MFFLKYSSWASLNVIKCKLILKLIIKSILYYLLKNTLLSCTFLIYHFKGGKLTTILVGYPLTFWKMSVNIVTLKGVFHYNLLENHFYRLAICFWTLFPYNVP